MVLIFINLFVMLIMCLTVFFVDIYATKPKRNIVLGATVPDEIMKDKKLLDIVQEFKKNNVKLIIVSVLAGLPQILLAKYAFYAVIYLVLWIILLMVYNCYIVRKSFKAIQSLKKEYDQNYSDDDKYYGPFFYNNPNDKSFMVEKRFGIGTTINIAHPIAKVFIAIMTIVIVGTLIIVGGVLYKLDNAKFSLTQSENKIIIDAPMYGIEFNKDEIEEVKEISDLPEGSRRNGAETDDLALGNYRIDGYGKSNVFVHKQAKTIIVIKLKEEYVFLTGQSEEETEQYYSLLRN